MAKVDPFAEMSKKVSGYGKSAAKEFGAYKKQREGELGLPGLRQQAQGLGNQVIGLEGSLSNLPQQVANQSRGFDVNADQLAMIQNEKAMPLQTQLSNVGREANRAYQNLSGIEGTLGSDLSVLERMLGMRIGSQNRGADIMLGSMTDKRDRGRATKDSDLAFQRAKELAAFNTDQAIRQSLSTREPKPARTDPNAIISGILGRGDPARIQAGGVVSSQPKQSLQDMWGGGATTAPKSTSPFNMNNALKLAGAVTNPLGYLTNTLMQRFGK